MVKPGWFNKADLVVYTTDGTYSTTVKIKDVDFESINKKEIIPKYIPQRKVSDELLKNTNVLFYQNIVNNLFSSSVELSFDSHQKYMQNLNERTQDYLNEF